MSDTRWVVLDVGETLVDETRVFRTWAEIFGLPELTLMAVLGGSISNANDADGWRRFFELIQHPDWQDSRPDFEARYGALRPDDLYPDALRAIDGLKERGYRVAITANQPARRHAELEALGVRVEAMGMSDAMGVFKPEAGVLRAHARPARLSVTGRRRVRRRPGRQRRAAIRGGRDARRLAPARSVGAAARGSRRHRAPGGPLARRARRTHR